MLKRAGPILKGRIIETLSTRFNSRVDLDALEVSVTQGLDVSGQGLRILPPDDVVAAGATAPLIAIRQFQFHAGLRGLFLKPTHIGAVHISGMTITIPPRQIRQQAASSTQLHRGKIKILVDTLVFDDSHLIIQNSNPNKDPKDWVLQHIVAHDFGPYKALSYDALLSNAIPRGEIHATGNFGPLGYGISGRFIHHRPVHLRSRGPEYDSWYRRNPYLEPVNSLANWTVSRCPG